MADTIAEQFFAALGSGGDAATLELVAPDATFEAQGPPSVPIYGRFEGHDGVRRFIATLRELFDTERFEIHQCTQSDGVAFAYGYMQHRRAEDRPGVPVGVGALLRSARRAHPHLQDVRGHRRAGRGVRLR